MIQTPLRLPKRDHAAASSASAMETVALTSDDDYNDNDDETQSILVAATVLHDTLTRAHSSGNGKQFPL